MLTALRILVWLPIVVGVYAYVIYPFLLRMVARGRRVAVVTADAELPSITITVPCYNEERSIRDTLEALLALDYPAEKRQILIDSLEGRA